ncbi:hypothetical protein KSU1_B0418 [Candidatus Jettenia caeni]|uniref:Uncharacterized protein n=1 Tax=Candidatus Jettenia caeni TaxID=247490 RepID=I3IHT0_9BACT|nr:hypothetical protein [Candidatus Jettenia sp. AMX1]WKZ16604.1 MAG: hypothetical protein QY317_04690 [Candidatus Jettenia caeni]GAB61275.1 hypothetical protein KSU1_B0418 [Candidatus Jettenia caeni]GIL20820.1 MAG: hypothetical protein BroJett041_19340 [Candidatus Jettenia caeni]GJQ47352.1 MAG: hypothetical protein JETCAE04_31060 [Candidatus Jettenia caeni]
MGKNSGEFATKYEKRVTDIQRAAEWYYLNRSCFGGDMQSGGFALSSVTGIVSIPFMM